jgi:hypothetical protein
VRHGAGIRTILSRERGEALAAPRENRAERHMAGVVQPHGGGDVAAGWLRLVALKVQGVVLEAAVSVGAAATAVASERQRSAPAHNPAGGRVVDLHVAARQPRHTVDVQTKA